MTPVALIIFKRLDATKRVVDAIRAYQPKEFFVIADGWRNDAEKEKCLAVRSYVEKAVDWPCMVHKNYSDANLGTKKRIVSGLDWVFEQVEEAIILEDDTVPDLTFFYFCEMMLEKYRNELRVMQIGALNIQEKNPRFSTDGASYYFSQFPEIWGWATWRRAWKLFDVSLSSWPYAKKDRLLYKKIKDPGAADYWEHLFDHIYQAGNDRSKSDVWAAQWVFAHLLNDSLSIVPAGNLVTNIGTTSSSARDAAKGSHLHNLALRPMAFPLRHQERVAADEIADAYSLKFGWRVKQTLREKILFSAKHSFPTLYHLAKKYFKARREVRCL